MESSNPILKSWTVPVLDLLWSLYEWGHPDEYWRSYLKVNLLPL